MAWGSTVWTAPHSGVKGHWFLPGGGRETWLWHTFRGADVARVASGIGVIWVIMVGM